MGRLDAYFFEGNLGSVTAPDGAITLKKGGMTLQSSRPFKERGGIAAALFTLLY